MKPRSGGLPLFFAGLMLALFLTANVVQATSLTAEIKRRALLSDGGNAAMVALDVTCPSGWQPLEAFVYISQDGYQSQFAPIPVSCDDALHQYRVKVVKSPDAPPFHRGRAFASAYILIEDGSGGSQFVSPSSTILLRWRWRP